MNSAGFCWKVLVATTLACGQSIRGGGQFAGGVARGTCGVCTAPASRAPFVASAWGFRGVSALHAHHAHAVRCFFSGWLVPPSQNALKGEQTLGYKTYANVPPSCPIRRLAR